MPKIRVNPGEAAGVMTGAPLPDGADASIKVEDTVRDGEFVVWPAPGRDPGAVEPGTGVTARGAEVRRGTRLLEAGARISPAAVGLLATVGHVRVTVGKRPRVAVFSTGDELRHPRTARPLPAQIRDANSHMLAARCRVMGFPVRRLGLAADDPERLAATIASGLASDVLLISGGVSMGRYDYVEPVLEAAGARLLVTAVAIRPGKPFVFGVAEGERPVLVFGLPGNPVSALTTFEVFAGPALRALEGHADPRPPLPAARLLGPVTQRGPRRAFLPARCS
jgi:molybdopterin molybdotransferase